MNDDGPSLEAGAPTPSATGPVKGKKWNTTGVVGRKTRTKAAKPAKPANSGSKGGGKERGGILGNAPVFLGGAVATAAVLGGGLYLGGQFLSGSDLNMAQALPANTVAFVEVNTDPSASQKVEALKTLNKWPELKKELGDADTDLRQKAFDDWISDSGCATKLTFARDVKPWIGTGAALAGVPVKDKVEPVAVFSVTDEAKAKAFATSVSDCYDALPSDHPNPGAPAPDAEPPVGFVVSGDYLYAGYDKSLNTVTQAAKSGSLADDATYQKWAAAPGDSGIANFYVSPTAAQEMAKTTGQPLPATAKDFAGAAGTLRFADSGLELEAVGDIGAMAPKKALGDTLSGLPDSTAAVVAFGVPDNAAKAITDAVTQTFGDMAGSMVSQLETQFGLKLPSDLQTLLGNSVVASVDGNPAKAGAAPVEVGVTIHGDSAKINTLVRKMEERSGQNLADMGAKVLPVDGKFVLASSDAYAQSLIKKGNFGDSDTLNDVVDDAKKATAVGFVDFNAPLFDDGAGMFMGSGELKPLKALGLSVAPDEDGTRMLLKVTTD